VRRLDAAFVGRDVTMGGIELLKGVGVKPPQAKAASSRRTPNFSFLTNQQQSVVAQVEGFFCQRTIGGNRFEARCAKQLSQFN
jgi:hypothetical protein